MFKSIYIACADQRTDRIRNADQTAEGRKNGENDERHSHCPRRFVRFEIRRKLVMMFVFVIVFVVHRVVFASVVRVMRGRFVIVRVAVGKSVFFGVRRVSRMIAVGQWKMKSLFAPECHHHHSRHIDRG